LQQVWHNENHSRTLEAQKLDVQATLVTYNKAYEMYMTQVEIQNNYEELLEEGRKVVLRKGHLCKQYFERANVLK